MSVYKGSKSKTYRYSFVFRGVRFYGPTGKATEREARKVEAKKRAELEDQSSGLKPKRREMTLREAAGRYWEEVGKHQEQARTNFGGLERLLDGLGPNILLSSITTDNLSAYQSTRREQGDTRPGKNHGKPLANRTLNAEVPELISQIFKRARLWKVNLGNDPIVWKDLKLSTPKERVRAGTRREMLQLLRKLRRDYRPIVQFALVSGLRRRAFLLRKDQIDWERKVLIYKKKSKHTQDTDILPITPTLERILLQELAKAPDDCEFVFTYIAVRTYDGRIKGRRYPITYEGIKNPLLAAIKAAGLRDWRMLHDMRHTMATNMIRRTKDLKLVSKALGHSNVSVTARYAHQDLDDLRAGLE